MKEAVSGAGRAVGEGSLVVGEVIVDFTPVVGDAKGFVDAYNDGTSLAWGVAAISLVPGADLFKFADEAVDAGKEIITVIGKLVDLRSLRAGERTMLDRLPNLGSPRANWKQNSGVLRQEMARGRPIRDASVDASGRLINNTGFLRAERDLLQSHGWTYDPSTTMWNPPVSP